MSTCAILCLHYNQQDRLPIVLDRWFSQSHKPDEFILIDDGSPLPIPPDDRYTIIHHKHNENLPFMYNDAVSKCKSDYVLMVDCSHLPFGKYFIEKQLHYIDERKICIPMFGRIKNPTDLPYNLFAGTYVPIHEPFHKLLQISLTDQLTPDLVYTNPKDMNEWYPTINVSFVNRKTFLRFNEGYMGWGLFDMDYQQRCLIGGFEIIGSKDHILVHWDHPQPEELSFYKGHDLRNRHFYRYCLKYYTTHHISYLTPEIETEIINSFKAGK